MENCCIVLIKEYRAMTNLFSINILIFVRLVAGEGFGIFSVWWNMWKYDHISTFYN